MKKEDNRYGIASLILGIFGLIFYFFFGIGIIPSILSIIFARKQKKINPNGITTAGLTLGILGTIINGIWILIVLLGIILL